jgi:RHS repeat-associated protein
MPSGQVWKYYYYAGGQPVAVRVQGDPNPQNNGLFYTLGDQLGSTSVIADSSGNKVSETRYLPWGETRYTSGSTPTDRKYTGQREDAGIGLYYYNARWYDAKLGRFAQADTIIPNNIFPTNFERYAYVANRPTCNTDPSGHCVLVCIAIIAIPLVIVAIYLLAPPEKREQAAKDVASLASDVVKPLTALGEDGYQKEKIKYDLLIFGMEYITSQLGEKLGENLMESRGKGGFKTAAEHLSMLMGADVGGYGPHPGGGNGWNKNKKNAEGLRTGLQEILSNKKVNETVAAFLLRQGVTQANIDQFIEKLRDYLLDVLPRDDSISKKLMDDLIKLGRALKVIP